MICLNYLIMTCLNNNCLSFLGKPCGEKVDDVRQKMAEKNATVLLVTALDEIACKFDTLIY